MPESKKRKKKASSKRSGARSRRGGSGDLPPVDGVVQTILRGGGELLEVEDPLDAELWASSILGHAYKRLPIDVQEEFDRAVFDGVVRGAQTTGDAASLAILRALAAVAPDERARAAAEAADRVAANSAEPSWAAELGTARFVRAWTLSDAYGDQIGFYAHFEYPGRGEHLLAATYDENLGGIIKDASAGVLASDPRQRAEREPDVVVSDIDPGPMASRVQAAIASGDLYLDNDWTDDFRALRALLLARMRSLLPIEWSPPEPPNDATRESIVEEFLASPGAPLSDRATRAILEHCLTARCDFGDGDPFRWSPIVVEMFLLDFLPRKATLDSSQIRALPDVLRRWVAYSLARRGLEQRWIDETIATIDALVPEFRRAVTDADNFGPAKAISNAMLADGVDLLDPGAVQAWLDEFNARPFEDRDAFLRGRFGVDDRPE